MLFTACYDLDKFREFVFESTLLQRFDVDQDFALEMRTDDEALLRAVEARLYQELLPLVEPVLDVGCGDGHFASVAFPQRLAAGLDPAPGSLREARDRRAYRVLAQARGDAIPHADGAFATVVSNSVLEHIPGVEEVIAEIARVLAPGGRFIFCVPGDYFTELLFFAQLFDKLRLAGLARAYERYFNRISRHYHCDGPDVWRIRLASAGLQVSDWFYYFSDRALHALDLASEQVRALEIHIGSDLIHVRPELERPELDAACRRLEESLREVSREAARRAGCAWPD